MRFKILSAFVYAVSLLKKYNELQQTRNINIYRIADIKKTASDQYKVIIQVIGKSSIIECSPQEIIAIDWLLEKTAFLEILHLKSVKA